MLKTSLRTKKENWFIDQQSNYREVTIRSWEMEKKKGVKNRKMGKEPSNGIEFVML